MSILRRCLWDRCPHQGVDLLVPTHLSLPTPPPSNTCEFRINLRRRGETLKGWTSLLSYIHLLEWWTVVQFGWGKEKFLILRKNKPRQQLSKTESRLDCKSFWQGDISFSYFVRKAPWLPEQRCNPGAAQHSHSLKPGKQNRREVPTKAKSWGRPGEVPPCAPVRVNSESAPSESPVSGSTTT